MTDRDIFLIEVARRGRDGDYAGASEVAALQTRATALEARPNITSLNAVPNVNAPSPGTGHVLRYNGTAWEAQAAADGIPQINEDGVPGTTQYNVRQLLVGKGLTVENGGADDVARIVPKYSGTGASNTVARGDHQHTIASNPTATFGPQAYMSSGTRSLVSTNATLENGVGYLVKAQLNMQIRGADPGACYYQLRVTINGNARTSGSGTNGFWCVQGVPDKTTWQHSQQITGTGAAITVSADVVYHSGGGFYTDAGEIEITLIPRS